MIGIWRNIPGTEGKYQASVEGDVRHLYKNGKVKILSLYRKKGRKDKAILRDRLFVKIVINGQRKEMAVLKIMLMTFATHVPEGHVPYHKDGDVTNNAWYNIGFITRSELGKKTGGSSRRIPVEKLAASGEVIEAYKSARAAARENYMSYQALMDVCNGKIKRGTACDGYIYRYAK